MQTRKLTLEEQANSGWTHVTTITYEDLTDADTSQTLTALNVDAGQTVMHVGARLETAFNDSGSMTSLSLEVGDGGDVDRFLGNNNGGTPNAEDLHVDQTEITTVIDTGQGSVPYNYTSDDTVDAIFTSAGGNLNTLTAGKVHIYFEVREMTA